MIKQCANMHKFAQMSIILETVFDLLITKSTPNTPKQWLQALIMKWTITIRYNPSININTNTNNIIYNLTKYATSIAYNQTILINFRSNNSNTIPTNATLA